MKYYTNRQTLDVYAYQSYDEVIEFNEDFENLVEMTDELFQQYREQKPGHKWSLNGWVEDEELMQEFREQEKQSKILEIESRVQKLEQDLLIANIRGKDITEISNELDAAEIELESLN